MSFYEILTIIALSLSFLCWMVLWGMFFNLKKSITNNEYETKSIERKLWEKANSKRIDSLPCQTAQSLELSQELYKLRAVSREANTHGATGCPLCPGKK